jgi:hypothetical protein
MRCVHGLVLSGLCLLLLELQAHCSGLFALAVAVSQLVAVHGLVDFFRCGPGRGLRSGRGMLGVHGLLQA